MQYLDGGLDHDSVQTDVVPVKEVDGKQHYDGEQPGVPLGNMTPVVVGSGFDGLEMGQCAGAAILAAQADSAQADAAQAGAAKTGAVQADDPQAVFAWVV